MKTKNRNKNKISVMIAFLLFAFGVGGCAKSEDRACFKGAGSYAELEIPLDSIRFFHLNERIKYRIYQDNEKKVIIKGGKNLIGHIDVDNRDHVLYVDNRNKCNFFRNSEDIVEVEIHYPYLNNFYFDATDSVVFENTVTGYSIEVEMRNGGGSLVIDVDVHSVAIVVSHGAADFTLSGKADGAELKIQNNGAANAIGLDVGYVFIYQNSTADFFINLDHSTALIQIDGTGDVFYNYNPISIVREGIGQGEIKKL